MTRAQFRKAAPGSARQRAATSQRACEGVTLVEALVAMAVMSFGMLALVGTQRTIAINADISRQVAEGTRITATEMADLRAHVTVDPAAVTSFGAPAVSTWRSSWASLMSVPAATVVLPAGTSDTTFTRETVVGPEVSLVPTPLAALVTAPRFKSAVVTTSWTDRSGDTRNLSAYGLYAAIDTALSTRVVMAAPPTPAVQRGGRNADIPASGVDVRDSGGRPATAVKPFDNDSGIVWVFDNATGLISRVCRDVATTQAGITTSTLVSATCADAGWSYLVTGTVRFDQGTIPSGAAGAEVARDPRGSALPLASTPLRMVPDSQFPSTLPSPECFAGGPYATASNGSPSAIDYVCRIVVPTAGGWGGKLDVVPDGSWSIGTSGASFRVCRYTPSKAADGDYVDNPLHPETYCRTSAATPMACIRPVTTNLLAQNFLVIRGDQACPIDTAVPLALAGSAIGEYINSNTRPHQP